VAPTTTRQRIQTTFLKAAVVVAVLWSLGAPLAGAAIYGTGTTSKTPHGVAKVVFFCHLG
jgi:hypothetical protein